MQTDGYLEMLRRQAREIFSKEDVAAITQHLASIQGKSRSWTNGAHVIFLTPRGGFVQYMCSPDAQEYLCEIQSYKYEIRAGEYLDADAVDLIEKAGFVWPTLRTVYLCDYFTLPDFRRPLYRVLERGESVHALQRQICTQPLPAKRGRRTEELIATSGALTLLTNCVMAWNTQRLQRAVERESQRTAPRYSIDALRSVGPVGHRHINFRGTYRFPIERYADRLVASAA
jgi:Tn3 transposase DDE domain